MSFKDFFLKSITFHDMNAKSRTFQAWNSITQIPWLSRFSMTHMNLVLGTRLIVKNMSPHSDSFHVPSPQKEADHLHANMNLQLGWLVVFYVQSTLRSLRDGTPIFCPLRRTWSSIFTPFPPGIEPLAVAWQSITLPLRFEEHWRN